MADVSKEKFDRAVDLYSACLEIGRSEFLGRVRDACNRKRDFYVKLKADREYWAKMSVKEYG